MVVLGRGIIVVAVVVLVQAREDPLVAALASDDECLTSGGEGCALHELQRRAVRRTAIAAEARANPVYCKSIPEGVTSYCNSKINTCGCVAYCRATADARTWGWDPQCCACPDTPVGTPPYPSPVTPKAVLPSSFSPAEPRPAVPYPGLSPFPTVPGGLPAGTVPFAYDYEAARPPSAPAPAPAVEQAPAQAPAPALVGEGEAVESRGRVGAAANEIEQAEAAAGSEAAQAEAAATHPVYCHHLPPGVTSPLCSPGVNTCKCRHYCTAHVAPANWGWDPNCCGCGAPAPATGTCAAQGCSNVFQAGKPCQCNPKCEQFKNCCPDFGAKCRH